MVVATRSALIRLSPLSVAVIVDTHLEQTEEPAQVCNNGFTLVDFQANISLESVPFV